MASGVEELLKVVPRLVDRTRRQADFARALLAVVPCLSGVAPNADSTEQPALLELDGEVAADEPVDVLSVLDADPAPSSPAPSSPAPSPAAAAPDVATLAIEGYDSLAASQVVPRLVTLSKVELDAVQRYEQSHRHRQTILNRVAQLLEG